jgi:hypothetical protein
LFALWSLVGQLPPTPNSILMHAAKSSPARNKNTGNSRPFSLITQSLAIALVL